KTPSPGTSSTKMNHHPSSFDCWSISRARRNCHGYKNYSGREPGVTGVALNAEPGQTAGRKKGTWPTVHRLSDLTGPSESNRRVGALVPGSDKALRRWRHALGADR